MQPCIVTHGLLIRGVGVPTPNAPAQLRAAQRTVRCNRLLGLARLDVQLVGSTSPFPILWVAVLMADDKDSHAAFGRTIDDGIGEAVERKRAPLIACRCTEVRIADQEFGHTLKFVEQSVCYRAAGFAAIEPDGIKEVDFCLAMKRVAQRISERIRSTASRPDTAVDDPFSISASRAAATLSHASSRALSASRLATTRSKSLARSVVGKRNTSASKASMGNGIFVLLRIPEQFSAMIAAMHGSVVPNL